MKIEGYNKQTNKQKSNLSKTKTQRDKKQTGPFISGTWRF